jgi:hypothetical protein
MSREQMIEGGEDLGEMVLDGAKIKNEGDAACWLVAQLPYFYLFCGGLAKHPETESYLNEIEPKTGLSRRVFASKLVYEVGSPESKEDMSMIFIEDNGEKFTQIGFDKDKAPVILIDMNFKRPKMSLVEKVLGTNTLKFTSEMLSNIFDTFVKIQLYRDENLAKNQK